MSHSPVLPIASRRTLLRWCAGVPMLAAISGHATLAAASDPALPWRLAGSDSYSDPRMRALSWAILVPNPHNLQPWIAVLEPDGSITLLAEPARRLPVTDPYDRQLTIGFGAFLEMLRMAAASEGRPIYVDPLPEGEDPSLLSAKPVARIRLGDPAGAEADPLFQQARARRTNKASYDVTRPVPEAHATALRNASRAPEGVAVLLQSDRVRALIELCSAAGLVEFGTPRAARESIGWMRFGAAEIAAAPDGINIGGPMIEQLLAANRLDRSRLADPAAPETKMVIDAYAVPLRTAMGFVVLTSPTNDRRAQLAVGRDWLRIQLAATPLGLGLHPYSQPLQEFPEMAPHYAEAHRMLAPQGGTVQMVARLGFGPEVQAKPRWPVEQRTRRS